MNDSNSDNIINLKATCFDYVRVFSDGIRNEKNGETILQHSFVRFQFQLIILVSFSHFFHLFFKRYHFPRITSDCLAGILLGPTFFKRYFLYTSTVLFPPLPNQVLASLIKTGYILFIFLAGVRTDPKLITKVGKNIVVLALFIFAFPYIMSQTLDAKVDPSLNLTAPFQGALLNNVELFFSQFSSSQFVDCSAILMQLKISNSRIGHITLATALLSDMARYIYHNIVFSTLNRLLYASSVRAGILFFIHLVLFVGFLMLVARKLIFWFIRATPQGQPIKDIYMNCIIAMAIVLAFIGDGSGMDPLLGPLVLGLIIPSGSPLAITITSKFDTIVYGLLIPLLCTYCASKIDIWALLTHFDVLLNFQMSFIGYAFKLLATFIFLLAIKINLKEAVVLALLLNVKGPREMGTFMFYTNGEDWDSTSGVTLVFLLASYAPPLIKLLYDPSKHYVGYKGKCIQTSHDAKLEILACAIKQEDALSAIKLLELSNSSKDSPLIVHGLCMDELLGSDTPYIIDHQFGQKKRFGSRESNSQPIIDIFKYFMLQHQTVSHLDVFTAVSPLKSMHEDICRLAFDKTCSLIVLPFHQKWNHRGQLVSNSNDLRNMNKDVLERAPCSVGILIDRSRTQGISSIFNSSTFYKVAVFFVGGDDDREALAYALRMVRSRKVQLTVVCFNTPDYERRDSWEYMLDHESLKKIKQEMTGNNINYIEETVRDGSQTITIVQSIKDNFDLILVGRRHETQLEVISGLSEWAEFSELGPIGDHLVSLDFVNSVSILVVQQQIMQASHSSTLN